MVDMKRFIEKQLPAISDEWALEYPHNLTAPSESFGINSSETLWTRGTTDLLDNNTMLLLIEPERTQAATR